MVEPGVDRHHDAINRFREHGITKRKGKSEIMLTSFQFLATWLRAHARDEEGASLVEYALLVALIAVVCIAAITLLGGNASSKFDSVATSIN